MEKFKIEDYTINVCRDIIEWGVFFYGIPEDAQIQNIEELTTESMGFAIIEDKEIFIFIPIGNQNCYKSTIAHEIGHIIEGGFKKNPTPRMNKLHEKKAEHYEYYFNLVTKIINYVESNILH